MIGSLSHLARGNISVFLAAFYSEIVSLARLFCSPAWRDVARQVLTSTEHQLAIAAEINRRIGRVPGPYGLHNYQTDRWLRRWPAPR